MNRWRSHSKMEWLAQTGREIALLTFAALGYFWKWICSNKETSLWTGWPGGAIEMVPPTLSPAQSEQENTVCHPFSMPATTSVNNEQTLKTALPRAVFATKASQRQKATRITMHCCVRVAVRLDGRGELPGCVSWSTHVSSGRWPSPICFLTCECGSLSIPTSLSGCEYLKRRSRWCALKNSWPSVNAKCESV